MPKLNDRLPKYRLHKPSGRAAVTLGGKDLYLGKHGAKASQAEYDRVVGEWVPFAIVDGCSCVPGC